MNGTGSLLLNLIFFISYLLHMLVDSIGFLVHWTGMTGDLLSTSYLLSFFLQHLS